MFQYVTRVLCAVLSLTLMVVAASAQTNLTAKANNLQPVAVDGAGSDSDRAHDGLLGPVRRVRTEVVKLSTVAGKSIEDTKRVVLETAEYDLKGSKTQNQYFPITGATLTGREVYKYDDKGNISEMTLVNADGSLVSKEVYKYDFDSVGNWVKMTTSVAVVEDGKISFEPTEVTYRVIFYYLDASMAKMLQPASTSSPAPAKIVDADVASKAAPSNVNEVKSNSAASENRVAAALPPQTSLDKLKVPAIQGVTADLRNSSVDANKKVVVATDNEPPPPPRPLLKPVSGGVLNGMALSLPAPLYPEVARRMRATGVVEVEVVVDENGKVISARAISGPNVLRDVAVQAAYRAHFSPTKLSGQPVKITGRINYNFTMP